MLSRCCASAVSAYLSMLRFLPAIASCSTLSLHFKKFKPHTCCAMGRQAFNGVIIDQARRASVHLAGERASRVSVINLNVLAPPPEKPPKPASHRQTKSAPWHALHVAKHSRTEK